MPPYDLAPVVMSEMEAEFGHEDRKDCVEDVNPVFSTLKAGPCRSFGCGKAWFSHFAIHFPTAERMQGPSTLATVHVRVMSNNTRHLDEHLVWKCREVFARRVGRVEKSGPFGHGQIPSHTK
jgi:hypothetical protein